MLKQPLYAGTFGALTKFLSFKLLWPWFLPEGPLQVTVTRTWLASAVSNLDQALCLLLIYSWSSFLNEVYPGGPVLDSGLPVTIESNFV